QSIRKDLNLSMEQFAFLMGCTRQSLHNWDRSDRNSPQSRMADLLMKLIRESWHTGKTDVVRFLVDQAREVGISIQLGDQAMRQEPIRLEARRMPWSADRSPMLQLAAETDHKSEIVALVKDDDTKGVLSYDFRTASLELKFVRDVGFDRFHVELHFNDGQIEKAQFVTVKDGRMRLLSPTQRSENDVTSV